MTSVRHLLAFGLLLTVLAGAAHAQAPTNPSSGFGSPASPVVGGKPTAPTKREPLPPALPGARTDKAEAAPPQRPPADMPPTEALFDGINRGDMAAVRDALNRGAEINGRNVLGLTPTELSVDLGRNDITFLLLSQRGAPTGAEEPARTAAASADRPEPGAGKRPATAASSRAARARAEPDEPVVQAAPRSASRAPQRQYAGDGGTPIPQAGFLGFGGSTR